MEKSGVFYYGETETMKPEPEIVWPKNRLSNSNATSNGSHVALSQLDFLSANSLEQTVADFQEKAPVADGENPPSLPAYAAS